MAGVFINYRSADSGAHAALVYLALSRRFGSDLVFLDSESIDAGDDFVEVLLERVRSAGVLLAVLGPGWLAPGGVAGRCIDDPGDWIRRELVEAFATGVRVIPVLVDGADMPTEADLPADIAALGRCQFRRLRHREASGDLARILADLAAADPGLAAAARERAIAVGPVAEVEVSPTRKGIAEALFGGPAVVGRAAAGWAATAAQAAAPSRWLDPAGGVVRLRTRPEAAELVDWCRQAPDPVLRLVCGPGGQGKTQLAAQVCRMLNKPKTRWVAGFVRFSAAPWPQDGGRLDPGIGEVADPSGQWAFLVAAMRAAPMADVAGVLLVVDYAETCGDIVPALLRAAVEANWPLSRAVRPLPVRILLLAREEPDWWRNVADLAEPGWVDPRPLWLRPLPEALARRGSTATKTGHQLWTQAVEAFTAKALRMGLLTDPVPLARLAASPPLRFPTTLDLYADALLRVLDHAASADRDAGAHTAQWADPILGIVDHERRLLARSLRGVASFSGLQRDLAVSAAFLRPATGLVQARAALAASPALAGAPEEALNALALRLAELYRPADGVQLWRPPHLDRLTDTYLLQAARGCRSDAEWSAHVVAVCGADQPGPARHPAWTLVRSLDHPQAPATSLRRVRESLTALVDTHPRGYVSSLVALAPGRFATQLAAAIHRREPDTGRHVLPGDMVERIDDDLRAWGFTTSRTGIAVAVSQRLVKDSHIDEQLADRLIVLSRRLAENGDPAAAVGPAWEAVDRYRDLCPRHSGPHLTGLANALTNLSNRLAEQGDAGAARRAAEEATTLRQALAADGTDKRRSDAAASLHNLALRLAEDGQPYAALDPAQGAVTAFTALVAANPAYRPQLATALTTLAQLGAVAGDLSLSASPARQAVQLLRPLARANPDSHRRALAAALLCRSAGLTPPTGMPRTSAAARRAVHLAAEAVAECRELAAANPSAHDADLGAALANLGLRYAVTGQRMKAIQITEEALTIRWRLARHDPQGHGPDLAANLNNLAQILGARHAAALSHARAAVDRYRELAPDHRAAQHGLPAALANLGCLLGRAGDHAAAITATTEAIDRYGALYDKHPDPIYRLRQTEARHNLGLLLLDADRTTGAVAALEQAIDGYCELAETTPHALRTQLRDCRSALQLAQAAAAPSGDHPRIPTRKRRYTRQWHEEAIRYGLPGATLLAAWRSDLTTPDPRDRRVRDELLGPAADRGGPTLPTAAAQATTASTASTAMLPGLAARIPLVRRLTDRLASSRLVAAVATHLDVPAGRLLGIAAAVITAATAAVITLLPHHHPGRDHPEPTKPSAVAVGTTATARPPGNPAPADPSRGSTTHSTAGLPILSSPQISTTPPPSQPTKPSVPITDSATHTRTTTTTTTSTNTNTNTATMTTPDDPSTPPSCDLGPDAGCPITVDLGQLPYAQYQIFSATDAAETARLDAHTPQSVRLPAGQHRIHIFSASVSSDVPFRVDDDGTVEYQAPWDKFLSGQHDRTLIVTGRPVTLDARALAYGSYGLSSVIGWSTNTAPREAQLLPGHYTLTFPSAGIAPIFTLTENGIIEFEPRWNPYLSLSSTGTLIVTGRQLRIDATAVPVDRYGISTVTNLQNDGTRDIRLMPGTYTLAFPGIKTTPIFTITNNGAIDFDPIFDAFLLVRDDTTLVVRNTLSSTPDRTPPAQHWSPSL